MADKARVAAFKISGMDCADEVAVLKSAVGPLVGGEARLAFDLLKGRMSVLDAPGVTVDAVVNAVASTGMRAEPWVDTPDKARVAQGRARRTGLTVASGLFTAVGFGIHVALTGSVSAALGSEGAGLANAVPVAARIAYSLAIVTGVWRVLPRAWFAIRSVRPDMNLLMTIAVIGAVGIGEWFEAATVAFLFAVSLALETWSVGRARRAVEALLELAPDTVRLVVPGGFTTVPAAEAPVGARFAVRPGERIPLDGRVVAGTSSVNQAPITGESLPVLKEPGVEVFAGTINGEGAIEVESTKVAGDSTLSHIISLIDSAQSRRAPVEQWVERFARVYTPVVFAMAAAVALGGPLVAGDWSGWFYSALVLLVIGCPCALVISTPVSVVAALAAAARNGVLIKGGAFIEAPASIRAIALDKTGTLTEGRPAVVAIIPQSGHTELELLAIAAGLETHSDHPLAHAILAYAGRAAVDPARVTAFTILPGKGATGAIEGVQYWLGSHRYLEERGQATPAVHAELDRMSSTGRSVVVVGNAEHVCGMIALADTIRPTARDAVARLGTLGVQHVVMLTGDNRPTAAAIAREAGVHEVMAELLPADKVAAVEALAATYGTVAMIGDGVNDAPAMARATLGIAMGAAGSDAAIETADIALMSDDLAKVPWLIQHSRRTLAIIRQNIALSLGVKVLFVVLTLMGAASLWAAIVADMGMSLLVIANALRLLRIRACNFARGGQNRPMRWLALMLVAGSMAAAAEAWPRPVAQGQPPPDLSTLRAAYDRDPTDMRTAMQFVAGALRAGQPAMARPALYALLSRPSSLPASVAAEAWFQMGHVHLSAQEYEEAVACWETVVRDHGGSDRASGAAINAASVLLQVLDDPDRAYNRLVASLRDRAITGPHLELANFLLFQIYVERHDYANARGLLASLPGSGPRHGLIQEIIPVVLWKTGDEAVARRQIESLFADAADDASALNNLAGTLASHGVALDTAIAAAARGIVLSDTRHDIWDTYAEALFRSGQIEKAIGAEEKAIALATAQTDQAEYRARLARFKTARKPPMPAADETVSMS